MEDFSDLMTHGPLDQTSLHTNWRTRYVPIRTFSEIAADIVIPVNKQPVVYKIYVTAQEPEFRNQEPGVGMRTPAATFEDLGYCDVSELMQVLEKVSTLREAYSRSILDSGS
ncbi:MAG: hypothetical protein WCP22_06865 [Chlamydiota bacterium]